MAADNSPPDEQADELATERRLKMLMSDVEPSDGETIDRQVAVALAEFRRAGRRRAPMPRLARMSVAAATLALVAGGGWWARGVNTDAPAVAAENIRPVRGLTSPCPAATGVYVGITRVGDADAAVYVEIRGTDVSVQFVDPSRCSVISVLPAPSPGR